MSAKAIFGSVILVGAGFVAGFVTGTKYDLDFKTDGDDMPKVMISKRKIQSQDQYCTECTRSCESCYGMNTSGGDEEFGEGFDDENPFGGENDGSTGIPPVTDPSQVISGNATVKTAANAAEAMGMDK